MDVEDVGKRGEQESRRGRDKVKRDPKPGGYAPDRDGKGAVNWECRYVGEMELRVTQ